jgi:hypothetical protein
MSEAEKYRQELSYVTFHQNPADTPFLKNGNEPQYAHCFRHGYYGSGDLFLYCHPTALEGRASINGLADPVPRASGASIPYCIPFL